MKSQTLRDDNTQDLSLVTTGDKTKLKAEEKSSIDPRSEIFVAVVFLMAIAISIAMVFVTANFVFRLGKAILKRSQEKNLYSAIKESQAFNLAPVPVAKSLSGR